MFQKKILIKQKIIIKQLLKYQMNEIKKHKDFLKSELKKNFY